MRSKRAVLAECGVDVSSETIRRWCLKCGALYAYQPRRRQRYRGDLRPFDKAFVKINGRPLYPWRAVA